MSNLAIVEVDEGVEIDNVFGDAIDNYRETFNQRVDNLVDALLRHGTTPINEPYHHFAPHVYARELFIPKGQLVVGKVHKTEHLNIITKGFCSVATIEGVEHLEGPVTFVSKAGIQKIVYAHEDTLWMTIHPTDETDMKKLEEELVELPALEEKLP